ncbi:unnamed protein product [Discula destructiva]
MSELKAQPEIPTWVSDLNSPLPYKSKAGGIPDPPGFPFHASGSSKVRRHIHTYTYTHTHISCSPTRLADMLLQKKDVSNNAKMQPRKQATPEEMDVLKLKKAWEVALAPVKSLPMTAIMMYMTGNTLQIFSIMMVFMAFKNPIVGLIGTSQAFEKFETDANKGKMLQVKLAYVAMQLVALAVGIYKVNAMGLLPTTRSDWLAWEAQRDPLESAVVAF